MAKKSWFFIKNAISRYFLEKEEPFSRRQAVNLRMLGGVLFALFFLFATGLIYFGRKEEVKQNSGETLGFTSPERQGALLNNLGVTIGGKEGKSPVAGDFGGVTGLLGYQANLRTGMGRNGGSPTGRAHSANQVVRRGAGGSDPGAQLSIGQGIQVKLLNAILSTDSTSPVIAEVLDDVYIHGMVSIPANTRVIGSAHYDERSGRIQLKFGTLVYPEGDQHAIQALGMMSDGSAGLEGDYHSGEFKRQTGRFMGHFISGMASGMKERKPSGPFGMTYEPGSLKNGILNGVSLSSEDQAKSISEDLNSSKPTMTLPAGQIFILYLEREYIP